MSWDPSEPAWVKVPASAVPARSRRTSTFVKDETGWWREAPPEELITCHGAPGACVLCPATGDVFSWYSDGSLPVFAFLCARHFSEQMRLHRNLCGAEAVWSEDDSRWCEPVTTDDGTFLPGAPLPVPPYLRGDPTIRPG